MNKLIPSIVLGASLLAGCAVPGALLGNGAGEVDLKVRAAIHGTASAYRTQDASLNYTRASINHLQIKLYAVDSQGNETDATSNGQDLLLDLPASQLDQELTFKKLHADTKYRIKAYAYKAEGTADQDLISTEDASSSVDITVHQNPQLDSVTVPVQLKNVPFQASATGSITVGDGGVLTSGEALDVVDTAQRVNLTLIASGPLNFLINSSPFSDGLYTTATQHIDATAARLAINNLSNFPMKVQDLNTSSYTIVSAYATASVKIPAVGGEINYKIIALLP